MEQNFKKNQKNIDNINFICYYINTLCGSSSVDRAIPCQGIGRGFEPRLPLHKMIAYVSYYFFVIYREISFIDRMSNIRNKKRVLNPLYNKVICFSRFNK